MAPEKALPTKIAQTLRELDRTTLTKTLVAAVQASPREAASVLREAFHEQIGATGFEGLDERIRAVGAAALLAVALNDFSLLDATPDTELPLLTTSFTFDDDHLLTALGPPGSSSPAPAPGSDTSTSPPDSTPRLPDMAALTDLDEILASLEATLRGNFVYCVLPTVPDGATPLATVAEDEGLTVVVPVEQAARLGVPTGDVFTCITLNVHSALNSVGLTAAVSTLLAEHDISCNVIAGFHHDHLLVPAARAVDALALLSSLAEARQ